jgi:hypothetical protein
VERIIAMSENDKKDAIELLDEELDGVAGAGRKGMGIPGATEVRYDGRTVCVHGVKHYDNYYFSSKETIECDNAWPSPCQNPKSAIICICRYLNVFHEFKTAYCTYSQKIDGGDFDY